MTNETAATCGVMYADEGSYKIDVRHLCWRALRNFAIRTLRKTLKRWWGRLEKQRVATESGGDETGDETGGPSGPGDETDGPGDETGDKTAATAGHE